MVFVIRGFISVGKILIYMKIKLNYKLCMIYINKRYSLKEFCCFRSGYRVFIEWWGYNWFLYMIWSFLGRKGIEGDKE